MIEKLAQLWPEVILFATTCVVMVLGLSKSLSVRRGTGWIAGLGLLAAGGVAASAGGDPEALYPALMPFAKGLIAIVGLMLLLLMAGTVDREEEALIAAGKRKFDALRTNRAEFYAFILFSLTGLMLTVSADDLIWLFLALELTSLPTYIMVTISTRRTTSQEAGVKYFFLGALGAAIFLYGFALLYGATGTTNLAEIGSAFAAQNAAGGINAIGIAGLIIALFGVGFKIAAVPMHFYAADVYQGASSSVSAFLAFVPKTAGFIAIMLLLGTVGWTASVETGLPEPVYYLLWIMAALTMTVGNTLALFQNSVKRMLAYSSVAHSGYMLVGIIAGPGRYGTGGPFSENGLAAVLFYLLCYGVMNVGAFAVLACLERDRSGDVDDIDDLRGLNKSHPHLAAAMLLSCLSLLGLPPLLGFFGKLGLFTSAIAAGEITLVIILGINSAIAAVYYLRIAAAAYLEPRDESEPAGLSLTPFTTRIVAAMLSAGGVLLLVLFAQPLIGRSLIAASYQAPPPAVIITEDAGTVLTAPAAPARPELVSTDADYDAD